MLKKGQIGTTALVGMGLTIAMAAFGSFAASSSRTDGKVDTLASEFSKEISALGQRQTKTETESEQYRRDIETINKKLDTIIEKIGKK